MARAYIYITLLSLSSAPRSEFSRVTFKGFPAVNTTQPSGSSWRIKYLSFEETAALYAAWYAKHLIQRGTFLLPVSSHLSYTAANDSPQVFSPMGSHHHTDVQEIKGSGPSCTAWSVTCQLSRHQSDIHLPSATWWHTLSLPTPGGPTKYLSLPINLNFKVSLKFIFWQWYEITCVFHLILASEYS